MSVEGANGGAPSRMRVAFVSFDFGEYAVSLASAMSRHADTTLFVPDRTVQEHGAEVDRGVRVESFRLPRLRQAGAQAVLLHTLRRKIRRLAPHVIHLQQGHLWFNLLLPTLRRYPLVVTIHDPRHHVGDRVSAKMPRSVMAVAFRAADHAIVHGEALKQPAQGVTRLPAERVHVVPHHVLGTNFIAPGPSLARSADTRPSVLFFGRIWEYKGLEYLIRAQPLITAKVPQAEFVIAGEGEDLVSYRGMMSDPSRFVVHNRRVSDEERAQLFEAASVVVLPYIDASQSGVLPVAYAHGKPVVTTTVGALPEMVVDGETGYLVAPRDVEALAAAVTRILEDPVLGSRLGANGRSKTHAECSPEIAAERTFEVYRAATGAAALGAPS